MAVDVSSVAGQIWDAIKGDLGGLGADELAAAKDEARRLAQCLADVEAAKIAGTINEQQAKALIAGQLKATDGVLQAQLGIAELSAGNVLQAGLKVLVSVALGAAGLGWLVPILNSLEQTLQTAGVGGV